MIYIEGDGKAWQTRFKLSSDPTPDNPMALKLSTLDSSANVLYLARPCQYSSLHDPKCQTDKRFWSSHRYSKEILLYYNALLDQLKREFGFTRFQLVGYSGGGVIASLMAATRSDITKLITVSANLDHRFWVKYHNVSALSGSLSLYDYLEPLSRVYQFHLSGKNDKIVPPEINNHFIDKLMQLNPKNIHRLVIEDYDHLCCWDRDWSQMLKKMGTDQI